VLIAGIGDLFQQKRSMKKLESEFVKTLFSVKESLRCDDPSYVSQENGSKLWAINKPNIPQAPPG
jgi:hypothetical protein